MLQKMWLHNLYCQSLLGMLVAEGRLSFSSYFVQKRRLLSQAKEEVVILSFLDTINMHGVEFELNN